MLFGEIKVVILLDTVHIKQMFKITNCDKHIWAILWSQQLCGPPDQHVCKWTGPGKCYLVKVSKIAKHIPVGGQTDTHKPPVQRVPHVSRHATQLHFQEYDGILWKMP